MTFHECTGQQHEGKHMRAECIAHYKGIRFDNYCHVVLISLDVFINCIYNYNVLGITNYIHVG